MVRAGNFTPAVTDHVDEELKMTYFGGGDSQNYISFLT
jgi:predicted alpha/beta superfamily hydrolase